MSDNAAELVTNNVPTLDLRNRNVRRHFWQMLSASAAGLLLILLIEFVSRMLGVF